MNKTFLIAMLVVAMIGAGLYFFIAQTTPHEPGGNIFADLPSFLVLATTTVLLVVLALVGLAWPIIKGERDASGNRKSPLPLIIFILILAAALAYYFLSKNP